MTNSEFVLYGIRASLYTGKVRAYMRRNHIPFTERTPGHPDYQGRIMPEIRRFIIPVVERSDGTIVQDGTDILDFLEREGLGREPLYPDDPVLKSIALLFELFGNEGLLRPAMHYRWNFDDNNLDFLKHNFTDLFPMQMDASAKAAGFDHASGRMRQAARVFGVVPDTLQTIEDSYSEFLTHLNAHFENSPYLLGGRPTIGDYGLFNPLYAHLSRDPKPAQIMQRQAPFVWTWVERMNSPEHLKVSPLPDLFSFNALPESLLRLMSYVREEYAAEFAAHIEFTNQWLNEQDDPNVAAKGSHGGRVIGFVEFNWRGHSISTGVFPYRVYLAQRLWDHFDASSTREQSDVDDIFGKTGLTPFLASRTGRRVLRESHLEVWE